MRVVTLENEDDFDGWREAARGLAAERVPADRIDWRIGDAVPDLFAEGEGEVSAGSLSFAVPAAFLRLARAAICHSDPERFSLLYALLLRLRAAPGALADQADPLVRRIEAMAKEVRRDSHKMHAFVRFRETSNEAGPIFVAWFEPDHHIVRANAGFFVRRFPNMCWSILTPELSIHWDGETVREGPGATRGDAPDGDPIEEVWKTYYASIFNPARVKIGAMLKEMPKKYWKNMPETALIGALVAGARQRENEMVGAAPAVDKRRGEAGGNVEESLTALASEAASCTRCPLFADATQTVFGEGPGSARLMFVGEQPGDQEDLAGRPFVGPAGQVWDRALGDAGIDRRRTYVTNAVKHFKFVRMGRRRIHQKPESPEIESCRWWLDQERLIVRPELVVALGATAARALFGKTMTIGANRGRAHSLPDGQEAWITVHPSFLLRVPENKEREYARFVADLVQVRERLEALAARA